MPDFPRGRSTLPLMLVLLLTATVGSLPIEAQVHYRKDGSPWSRTVPRGPDAEVPGWFYNLGTTGLRVELTEERPETLLIRWVLPGTPAEGKVAPGERIIGIGGERLQVPHRNGYGMEVFGAHGPITAFAAGLERAQGSESGRLELRIEEPGGETRRIELEVGRAAGGFATSYPLNCRRSAEISRRLLDELVSLQREDGSWGSPPHDTFAPLALLSSGDPRFADAIERSARFHARTTRARDSSSLINWRYCAAGIVLSEIHLATGAAWILPELEEIATFLLSSQYTDLSQIVEKTRQDRPEDLPKDPLDSHGGWGHNPGFEGYGPISMVTGQAALALSLIRRCGIEVPRERLDIAYAFLDRGTGPNGYVWYEDQVAGPKDWADMGRTGAAGLANLLAPFPEPRYRERALAHARVIGAHPESFPDTHGSPTMGMGYAAAAALADPTAFRALLDANRWWFVLAECPDGTFYYQPNRDNAGYGEDSRLSATAVTAFILALPERRLAISGQQSGEGYPTPASPPTERTQGDR